MKFFLLPAVFSFCIAAQGAATFDDAVAAFKSGDSASAEKILESLLQSHPSDASALGLMGAVLDSEKKFDRAEAIYQQALRLNPHSAALLNNYANHQLAAGNASGARATYLRVIAIDPTRTNANLQLASMALEKKQGAEALRYLAHVPAADRTSPQIEMLEMQALFLAGNEAEANSLVSRLANEAGTDPRISFSAGLALASVAKYGDAERFFSRALEQAPGNIDVLYNLGLAAYHAGHLERAREALQTALAERPDDIDILYNLGTVQVDLKQREAALEDFAKAGRLDPKRANVQLAVAQTASSLGYYADARIAYQSYLKLVPGDVAAQRENDFMIAVSSDPRAGLAALRSFSAAHPQDVDAQYEVGLLEAQSDPSDALVHLEKALASRPTFAPARLGRGVVNLLAGNAAAALPDLEFAAAEFPDNSSVLDRLGEAYTALNRPADAIKVLQKASKIAPRDSRVLMHLSRAQAKAGQNEEARATLDKFRALGPKSGNLIPQPGIIDILSLSPEQQQAKYRTEVESRLREDPQNADLNVRHLEILIDEDKTGEIAAAAARLLALKPLAAQAAEAGHALINAGMWAEARPLLEYAANLTNTQAIAIDLAISIFHLDGAEAGLASLEALPEKFRSGGDYLLAHTEMLNAVKAPR